MAAAASIRPRALAKRSGGREDPVPQAQEGGGEMAQEAEGVKARN